MNQQAFVFIGRAGAGKGTQGKLLLQALQKLDTTRKTIYVETGAEFRKFIGGDSYTATLSRSIVEGGGLMPEFMPIYIWGKFLVETYTGAEHLVFDGTPRKLIEAKAFDGLFPFYRMGKPWIIYLDIEHEESNKRLSLRAAGGRRDDSAEAIERRRAVFEAEVKPTVDWYRGNPGVNFLDIDGERTIEEIHADIVKRLGLS